MDYVRKLFFHSLICVLNDASVLMLLDSSGRQFQSLFPKKDKAAKCSSDRYVGSVERDDNEGNVFIDEWDDDNNDCLYEGRKCIHKS